MIPPQVIVSWISEVQRWSVLCTYCFKVDSLAGEESLGIFIAAHKHEVI